MPLVSYAQNHEDIVLYRALKSVAAGFYVDVGANDPLQDSVTALFYELGWSGINIEPIPFWYRRLQASRPRDINLQVAASAKAGTTRVFEVPDTGWSTADPALAASYAEQGKSVRELLVPSMALDQILEGQGEREIHFLKIDVEGSEKDVLLGIDLQRYRPWVVLVEATVPTTQTPNYSAWDPLLTEQGYQYVYFDRVNRFYVAGERAELLGTGWVPPNVFDDFLSVGHASAIARVQEVEQRVSQLEEQNALMRRQAESAEQRVSQLEEQNASVEAELRGVLQSRSWRLTRPLRSSKRWIAPRVKPPVRWLLRQTLPQALRFSPLRRLGAVTLQPFPALKGRLKTFATHYGFIPASLVPDEAPATQPAERAKLSPVAQHYHARLLYLTGRDRGDG